VELYTEFADVSRIVAGTKDQVAGMDAGEVIAMEVPNLPPAKFRVKVRLDEKLSGLVRADALVTVGTEAESTWPIRMRGGLRHLPEICNEPRVPTPIISA
jgi:hypothetical protein